MTSGKRVDLSEPTFSSVPSLAEVMRVCSGILPVKYPEWGLMHRQFSGASSSLSPFSIANILDAERVLEKTH